MKKLLILILAISSLFACSQQITTAEYFFDTDPGFGQGISISLTPADNIEINEVLDISNLSAGMHTLNIRLKDQNNQWSSVLIKSFFIDENRGIASEITNIEYFIDDDPGFGNGIPYANFNSGIMLDEVFFANMTGVSQGNHSFSIRMKNEIQQWSQTLMYNFELISCDLTISGNISYQTGSSVNSGFVVLYQKFGEGSAMGVDTIYLVNGSYQFGSVCPNSEYFIKVLPENNDDFLSTYYGNTVYWQDASIISTDQSNVNGIDIITQDFAEMDPGTNRVGGHIYMAESRGEPVKNIDVVLEIDDDLEKSGYLPVALDRSDEYGAWEISGLPERSFRIKVEIPGLEMDTTYYLDITSPNTVIDNLNYFVDFNTGIFIDHFGIEEMNLSHSLNLYPNPATNGNFWIESEDNQVLIEKITIYQYSGQQVANHHICNQGYRVNVNHLSKGFYLISIQTNKGIINQKIMIQ